MWPAQEKMCPEKWICIEKWAWENLAILFLKDEKAPDNRNFPSRYAKYQTPEKTKSVRKLHEARRKK